MAALSVHCMHMLIKCTEVMKERRGDPDISMDYPEVIETACLTGPSIFAKYSTFARSVLKISVFPPYAYFFFYRRLIKVSLFWKEMAFCSVYLLLAGYYLYQVSVNFYVREQCN